MRLLRGEPECAGYISREEAQMKENVCVDCKHYESCKKPERYMKCMGYEEKERQQAAGENAVDVQDG